MESGSVEVDLRLADLPMLLRLPPEEPRLLLDLALLFKPLPVEVFSGEPNVIYPF